MSASTMEALEYRNQAWVPKHSKRSIYDTYPSLSMQEPLGSAPPHAQEAVGFRDIQG